MNIDFYGIKRYYNENRQIFSAVNDNLLTEGQVFGKESENLEYDLCKLCDRKFAVTVGSCTDALFFALKGLGIGKGDEVLVTSFSFIASASCIVKTGATPVFVDIDPDTFLMNINSIESKITDKTKAIIAVHLFGQTLPIKELEEISKNKSLYLIEDCAQGLGSKSGLRIAGSMGDVSCLSFDPTKIISSFGSGGALLTNNEDLYKFVKTARYHGKNSCGEFEFAGYNSRMSSSQCAIIRYQIKEQLKDRIRRLREIANFYKTNMIEHHITHPHILPENFHTFHKYVIRSEMRDELRVFLKEKGIATMIHYPSAICDHKAFLNCSKGIDSLEICREITGKVVSLPIYPELTEKEIEYICLSVNEFSGKILN